MIKRVIIIFLILIVLVATSFYLIINKPKDRGDQEDVLFVVNYGDSLKSIGLNLYREDLIWHNSIFITYAIISNKSQNLKAGHYLLNKSMSIVDIVNTFYLGNSAEQRITIIEGWNKNDIAEYLSNTIADFDVDVFLSKSVEGYLYPDTYNIPYGYTEEDIIKLMLDNFNKKITEEMRIDIARQGKTISDIVIMASIIEKEVRSFEDMALVSGILWKRIEHNIPLQSCATIVYITGKKSTQVTSEETKIDSPYNTYINRGLPIGPISNPGIRSIKAAIYPQDSEYFFYLSKPDGETVFSKTFDEHIQAKNKYLK